MGHVFQRVSVPGRCVLVAFYDRRPPSVGLYAISRTPDEGRACGECTRFLSSCFPLGLVLWRLSRPVESLTWSHLADCYR